MQNFRIWSLEYPTSELSIRIAEVYIPKFGIGGMDFLSLDHAILTFRIRNSQCRTLEFGVSNIRLRNTQYE